MMERGTAFLFLFAVPDLSDAVDTGNSQVRDICHDFIPSFLLKTTLTLNFGPQHHYFFIFATNF